ncbi:MAG TPA: BTAD domain-containing putative transcriptional regulator [Acidimicrobiales bacterium]|nr:BTAD domain-containing putative transcriptional regulator [Acidimicrobiales bacterium]
MEVRVFGGFEVADGGMKIQVRGTKQRALLALLALHRGKPVPADRLIDALWPDAQSANPANALQAQIAQLRRTLGAAAILTSEAGYALDVGPDDLDAARFEELVAEGRRLLEEDGFERASTVLDEALQLRRGEPLAEFAYAGFADAERAHLDELTLVALEARAEADLALGRHREVIGRMEALCREHPLRERLRELLILALYRDGRQADALRAYRDIHDLLVEELGIDPGVALRELDSRILAQDPTLTLDASAPRRSEPNPTAAGNLRTRLSSFVGRHDEIEALRETVLSCRLVTLVGPGGVGKTRMAVEAADSVSEEYEDGAWLVELAGVTEPEGVAPAAAGALMAAASALGNPHSPGSTTELILHHLADRSLIVVFDNCEHVIDQAAALADILVGSLPGIHMLATSREPLGVPGEVVVPMMGLPIPAAVELFEDRARAVQPGFSVEADAREVVEGICRRLDGLPLAIELAAARLRALPLSTLAERLDDRFRVLSGGARTALPRQQTLRAVVDWSYDLLFDDERLLFTRLSVFTGGCDLAAIESVCADDQVPRNEILDVLSRLVDKSLVTVDVGPTTARYSQLQTLWQYAREHLADSGEMDEIQARHAGWYLQLAEEGRPGLRGPLGIEWRARLEAELDNFRAGLDWFVARKDPLSALALVGAVAYLWFLRADFHEGYRWSSDAMAIDPSDSCGGLRGYAAGYQAYFGIVVLGPIAALDAMQQAITDLRECASPDLGGALLLLAEILTRLGDFEGSQAALGEALPLAIEGDEPWNVATHDMFAARNLVALGDAEEGEALLRASVDAFRTCGDHWMILYGLGMLAGMEESRGSLIAAAEAYEELIVACRTAGMTHFESMWLIRLAALRARLGDDIAAEQLFAAAVTTTTGLANSAALIGRAGSARRLGDLTSSRRWLDEAKAIYEITDLPAESASAFIGLAWWAIAVGDPVGADAYAEEARQRAAKAADPLIAVLAETVAAAVALSTSDTEVNRTRFADVLDRRSRVGRSTAFLAATLDEPDVEALVAAYRLEPA